MKSMKNTTLSPAQVRAYIESNNPACPYCGSEKIEGNCTGDEERQQEYSCKACGEEWDEIYLLSGLSDGRDGNLVRPALVPVHEAAPAMRSALEKIGHVLDPGESDPAGMAEMLRKISRIQEAGLAWNDSAQAEPAASPIDQIKERLAVIHGQLGDIQGELDALETEYGGDFENLSEEHQTTAQGQRIEAVNADLMQARRTIEGAQRDLSSALDELESATNKQQEA